MILQIQQSITAQREDILCRACHNLASELKLIEPTAFALFFQHGQMPEIYNLVSASLNRHFITNTISFACTGDTLITWNNPARVAIDLEFETGNIFVFFRLVVGSKEPSVELHHISFMDSSGDPEKNTKLLQSTLLGVTKVS